MKFPDIPASTGDRDLDLRNICEWFDATIELLTRSSWPRHIIQHLTDVREGMNEDIVNITGLPAHIFLAKMN